MGNCLSKKKQADSTMGSSFSGSKGGAVEVTKKTENLSLIQNDQSSGPKETTLKTIKQQHMEKVLDDAEHMIENENFSNKPTIKLLPHQHTLFCERKQRVCMSVGRLQEYETIQIEGSLDDYSSFVWVRRPPTAINSPDHSADEVIEDSENVVQYKITKKDVGLHICVRLTKAVDPTTAVPSSSSSSSSSSSGSSFIYTPSLGPVLPGPPRILDFVVAGSLQEGTPAVAQYEYIGGFEGVSDVWWMRIHPDGKREQITSEAGSAAPAPGEAGASFTESNKENVTPPAGSREYILTEADVGCTLKAKCRPVRSDGLKGEIFTSKSSGVVLPRGSTAEVAAATSGMNDSSSSNAAADTEGLDEEPQGSETAATESSSAITVSTSVVSEGASTLAADAAATAPGTADMTSVESEAVEEGAGSTAAGAHGSNDDAAVAVDAVNDS